jgi:hypothetical protein
MLRHRMWLAFFGYVAVVIALEGVLNLLNVSEAVTFASGAFLALLVGFEAATLRRFTLARRRWRNVGIIVGDDLEIAERRFFDTWTKAEPFAPLHPPVQRTAAPSDVIGLFPEPGRGDRRDRRLQLGQSAFGRQGLRACRARAGDQPIVVTSDPTVARADRVVLPASAPLRIAGAGLTPSPAWWTLEQRVGGGRLLGICVGMLLMAERGREYEVTPGSAGFRARSTARARRSGSENPAHGVEYSTKSGHPLLDGIATG